LAKDKRNVWIKVLKMAVGEDIYIVYSYSIPDTSEIELLLIFECFMSGLYRYFSGEIGETGRVNGTEWDIK
jgi:hypothetical protein